MIWYDVTHKLPKPRQKVYVDTKPPKDSGIVREFDVFAEYDGKMFLREVLLKGVKKELDTRIHYVVRWSDADSEDSDDDIDTYVENDEIKFYYKSHYNVDERNARFVKVLVPSVGDARSEMVVDLLNLPKNQVIKNKQGKIEFIWQLNIQRSNPKYHYGVLEELGGCGSSGIGWGGCSAIVVSEIYKLPNGEEIEVPLTSDNPEDLR